MFKIQKSADCTSHKKEIRVYFMIFYIKAKPARKARRAFSHRSEGLSLCRVRTKCINRTKAVGDTYLISNFSATQLKFPSRKNLRILNPFPKGNAFGSLKADGKNQARENRIFYLGRNCIPAFSRFQDMKIPRPDAVKFPHGRSHV